MKNLLLSAVIMCLFVSASYSQDFPKTDGSPMDAAYYPPRAAFRYFAETDAEKKAGEPVMRVLYSRPQKKGRDIFGGLEKFGTWWRIGANEATELLLLKDVTVNGTKLAAGRYSVHAKIEKDAWEIHFSTELDSWGSYNFRNDPSSTSVASISVKTQATAETVESLGIFFEKSDAGADMVIGWDNTMVRVPFQF
ncbi:MAG: DUF2911 domain-containing protein [Cytophagales bacterium]|nr:DUF2911 domain-containing protein [Cytophagales bacterium]